MKTLLVVEQATAMRDLLITNLQGATHAEITITDDYSRAIQLVAGGGFDAALIALNYATGAGLQMVQTLRQTGATATKLILMSTGDATTFEKPAKQAGADAFIEKKDCTKVGLTQLFQSLNLA